VKLRDVVVRVCCEEEDPLHTIEHSEYRMHEADGTQTLAGGLDGFGYAATHRDQRRHAVGRRRESAGRLTESGWRRNSVEHLLDDLRVTKTCHVDHRQGLVDVLEAAKGGAIRQDDVFHGLGRRPFLPAGRMSQRSAPSPSRRVRNVSVDYRPTACSAEITR